MDIVQTGQEIWANSNGWHLCVVTAKNSDSVTLNVKSTNESVTIPRKEAAKKLVLISTIPLEGVNDMSTMSELNHETIMCNISCRYENKNIYTSIRETLIAVNPYHPLDIYGLSDMQLYRKDESHDTAPHVYKSASRTYRQMFKNSHNQCVIISGESGAGKTETTKLIMKYLSFCSSQDDQNQNSFVKDQILATNPILEAMGNARTVYNDNSSRFGKYLTLNFDKNTTRLASAKLQEYLLEKSRIARTGEGEANFHIFYILLQCDQKDLVDKYEIVTDHKEYNILNSDCTDLSYLPTTYSGLMKAFEIIKLTPDEITDIQRVVFGILQLGNVEIADVGGESEIVDISAIEKIGRLFGFETLEFADVLQNQTLEMRDEVIVKRLTPSQSIDIRNSLCMTLYKMLFSWIINQINKIFDQKENYISIGLLDIFGFENFKMNGLDQLFINYANEKLQQYFNHHIFTAEQEEYDREGIEWQSIEFKDNKELIKAFEANVGVIHILHEESSLQQGEQKSFMRKLEENLAKAPDLVLSRSEVSFGVKHYAGKVTYQTDDFVSKNRDKISPEISKLLLNSRCSLIYNMATSTARQLQTKSKASLCIQFMNSLNQLMKNLSLCQPHFIRCVKPNTLKKPYSMDEKFVFFQLQYMGILETVRIRKSGYSFRVLFEDFSKLFFLLKTSTTQNTKDFKASCQEIMESYPQFKNQWCLGHHKIFVKEDVRVELYNMMETKIKSIMSLLISFMRVVVSKNRLHLYLNKRWVVKSALQAMYCSHKLISSIKSSKIISSVAFVFLIKTHTLEKVKKLAAAAEKKKAAKIDDSLLKETRAKAIELSHNMELSESEKEVESAKIVNKMNMQKEIDQVIERIEDMYGPLQEVSKLPKGSTMRSKAETRLNNLMNDSEDSGVDSEEEFQAATIIKEAEIEMLDSDRKCKVYWFVLSEGKLSWFKEKTTCIKMGWAYKRSSLKSKSSDKLRWIVLSHDRISTFDSNLKNCKKIAEFAIDESIEIEPSEKTKDIVLRMAKKSVILGFDSYDEYNSWLNTINSIQTAKPGEYDKISELMFDQNLSIGTMEMVKMGDVTTSDFGDTFVIIYEKKSYYLKCKSKSDADDWINVLLQEKAVQLQKKELIGDAEGYFNLYSKNGAKKKKYATLSTTSLTFHKKPNSPVEVSLPIDSLCSVDRPEDGVLADGEVCLYLKISRMELLLGVKDMETASKWYHAISAVIASRPRFSSVYERLLRVLFALETPELRAEMYLNNPVLTYSNVPISEPLCSLPYGSIHPKNSNLKLYRPVSVEAVDLFKGLLDAEMCSDSVSTIQHILKVPLDMKPLRDEIYAQLIKQTTFTKDPDSLKNLRYMQILACAACTYTPSAPMLKFVKKHLTRMVESVPNSEVSKYAGGILISLEQVQTRLYVPSRREILAVMSRLPMTFTFSMYHTAEMKLSVDPWCLVLNYNKILQKKFNVNIPEVTMGLFIVCKDRQYCAKDTMVMGDVITFMENVEKLLNDTARLVYKVRMFNKDPRSFEENSMPMNLLIHEMSFYAATGKLPLSIENQKNIVALYLQMNLGNQTQLDIRRLNAYYNFETFEKIRNGSKDSVSSTNRKTLMRSSLIDTITKTNKLLEDEPPSKLSKEGTVKKNSMTLRASLTLRRSLSTRLGMNSESVNSSSGDNQSNNQTADYNSEYNQILQKWKSHSGKQQQSIIPTIKQMLSTWEHVGSLMFEGTVDTIPGSKLLIAVNHNGMIMYTPNAPPKPVFLIPIQSILSFGPVNLNTCEVKLEIGQTVNIKSEETLELVRSLRETIVLRTKVPQNNAGSKFQLQQQMTNSIDSAEGSGIYENVTM